MDKSTSRTRTQEITTMVTEENSITRAVHHGALVEVEELRKELKKKRSAHTENSESGKSFGGLGK